jgi:hypothetical protein
MRCQLSASAIFQKEDLQKDMRVQTLDGTQGVAKVLSGCRKFIRLREIIGLSKLDLQLVKDNRLFGRQYMALPKVHSSNI